MELTQTYMDYFQKVNILLENQSEILVKLMNTSNADFIPTKKYPSDAGFDCRARLDKAVVIDPGKRASIPLGFAINIPINHTGDLRPRSGLTQDYGIMVGYGTIDAGYTGEVKATVFNFGEEAFVINPEDRIAQLVILPLIKGPFMSLAEMSQVDELIELERGNKGHGSTGIK